jgi:CelD/BcsL family acetyltransferase involved in cellulose biosynthesis
MVQIERISTLNEFASLSAEWNQVLTASGSDNIHLTHEWLTSWAATLGKGKELLILRFKENDETIGLAPLMIRTVRLKGLIPYRRIVFLADPESDFADFLITKNRPEVIQCLFNHLIEEYSWGELCLHTIPESSPNFTAIQSVLPKIGIPYEFSPHSQCYFIPIKQQKWDEFYHGTSKGNIHKDMRRLKNHYSKLTWEIKEWEDQDPSAIIPTISKLHQLSQTRKERESSYTKGDFIRFIERVIDELKRKGWIRIYSLNIEKQPVSFMLGFEYKNIFYWWNTGFDNNFKNLSPTKYLLYNLLKNGFEHQTWQEFNFMRGGSDYKSHWTTSFYNLYQIRIFNKDGVYGFLNKFRGTSNRNQLNLR